MAIPRKIYIRNNYIFVEYNLVVNNYLAKDVFVKMQDGGYLMTVDTREPFTIGLLKIGEILKQDNTQYTKEEWIEFYTKSTGSFISQSGSTTPGGGSSYDYTATNYTELVTTYPSVFEGKKAFVYESQGTEWLPGSLGGTYYPAGHYIFNGIEWRFYSENVKIVEPVRIMLENGSRHSSVPLSTNQVLLIASNTQRTMLRISNDSNQPLLIKYGTGVSTNSYTYKLMKGDVMVESDYYGDVYGIWTTNGTGNAVISETVIN